MDTKSLFKKAVNLFTLASFLLWDLSVAAPQGGSVAQGSAAISQSGTVTTVNQTSQNAVINWQSFNTASNEAVKFNQPNANAVALNRINNGQPTQFAGQLSANGNVWILNPAGVLFTSTARVDVAGLLATTHSISDANFMAGNYKFDLVPGSEASSIINNGLISAKDSGIVALVAPNVQNNGLIQVNLGKVSLSSGASYVLDMYGDELINFGSNAPISKGSVSNAGQIIANGGKVYMTANYASGVLDNMISMSGSIEAKSVGVNSKGQVILYGSDHQRKKLAGVTKVTGKLDTSDSTGGGNGGFIETSGAYLDIRSSGVINSGVGGTWLLDPYNITVVAGAGLTNNSGAPNFTPSGTSIIGADLINAQLNGLGSVTLDTGVAGSDVGDININAPLTWTSIGTGLTLIAAHDITIAAAITWNSGGSLTLNAGNNIMINGPLSYTNTAVNTGNMIMTAGNDIFLNSPISFINVPPHSFDLNLNAGRDIIMNSTVTNNVPLGSSVPFPFVHYTATRDILINSQFLITNIDQSLVINLNAGNEVHINANQSLPGNGVKGGSLNVTATNGIFINTPSLLMGFGAFFLSYEFFSPVHLLSDTQIDGQATQFDSTIDGAFNLTLNSLLYEFRDNIGSGTPLASLTVSGAPFRATGSIASISTTGAQTYNDNFFFFLINGMTFNASKVTLNNGLNNNNGTGAITFNSDLELTGQFGQVAAGLPGATTITGSTILHDATMYVGGQVFSGIPAPLTFMGPVTVLGNASLNVRNPEGSLEFMSTVNGTGSLNINNLGVPGGGHGLVIVDDVLDASSMSSFSIPDGALEFNGGTIIRDTQSYNIPILVTALGGTIDASTLVTLNDIVNGRALGNSGTLSINGNAVINGTVGGTSPLFRFYVSGTTQLGANINTYGDTEFGSAVTLTADTTVTDTGTGIKYDSTIDSDSSVTKRSLILNATAGSVQLQGDVGNSVQLNNLTVTGATGIYFNNGVSPVFSFTINTAGFQSYTGDIAFGDVHAPGSYDDVFINAGGAFTVNGQLTAPTLTNQGLDIYIVSGGDVMLEKNILLNPNLSGTPVQGAYLDVTAGAGNKIYLGTLGDSSTLLVQNGILPLDGHFIEQSFIYRSPVILNQNTQFTIPGGNGVFSTVDSNTTTPVGMGIDGNGVTFLVDFNGSIGTANPLAFLDVASNVYIIRSGVMSQDTSFVPVPGLSIITTGNQNYPGFFEIYSTAPILFQTTSGGTMTFGYNGIDTFAPVNVALSSVVARQPMTFDGNVTFNGDLNAATSVDMLNGTVTLNGVSNAGAQIVTTGGGQTYEGPVVLNGTSNVMTVSTTGSVTFTNTSDIDGPNTLQINDAASFGNVVTFSNGNLGTPISILNVAADVITQTGGSVINANGLITSSYDGTDLLAGNNTVNSFNGSNQFTGNINLNNSGALSVLGLSEVNGGNVVITNTGSVTYPNALDGAYNLTTNATGIVEFDGSIGATTPLAVLDVTGSVINLNTNQINTSSDQNYHSPVAVLGDMSFPGLNAGGNVTFDSTLDGPQSLSINATGSVTFNGIVGNGTPLSILSVSGSQININTNEMDSTFGIDFFSPVLINSGGLITFNSFVLFTAPVESTGTPAQIVINGGLTLGDTTVGASSDVASLFVSGNSRIYTDLLKTSGNITFIGTVDLTGDSVMTSTAGSITFGDQVSGNGCGFAWGLTVNTTPGLGTTTFEGDIGLPVFAQDGMVSFLTVNGTSVINGATIIQTNGNQTYGDTITLNNSVTMKTLVDGDIQFNGGGAVDPGITLSLYSADAAKGPSGLGITGTVNVDNLILGGPGGANLSLNYPITESFVAGDGAGQAIQNTVIDPLADFRSQGAIYCVNNFCALVPPNNNPGNIPPTEIFDIPLITSCDASGCSNLEIIMDEVGEVGVVNCVFGFMEAISESGKTRILMPGDMLYAGDTVRGSRDSQVCVKDVSSNKVECHKGSQA